MPPKSSKKAALTKSKSAVQEPLPNWPTLQPLVPSLDLSLETILEGQIIVIRNFLTSTLCKNYVSFLPSLPLVTTPGQPRKHEALRVNDRYQVDDPVFAEALWSKTALKELLTGFSSDAGTEDEKPSTESLKKLWGGEVLGLNPRVRIYRYGKGQFFNQHYDESNIIQFPSAPAIPARTTWTLLIYLTGPATGCKGGETIFYPELGKAKEFSGSGSESAKPIAVGLEVGMALLHKQ
ncbi:MAG: hypothetical protein Q9191_005185 [Dirinaria sp. TL-2023a]